MDEITQPAQTQAMRLIFEYEGAQVRLVSQIPVDVAVTGFDVARTERAGYYIDTRDAAGQTLARVPARGAFSNSTEVFPENPGELIQRVDMPTPRGAFTVIVPAPGGADHVSVVRLAPAEAGFNQPASRSTSAMPGGTEVTELARFTLQVSR